MANPNYYLIKPTTLMLCLRSSILPHPFPSTDSYFLSSLLSARLSSLGGGDIKSILAEHSSLLSLDHLYASAMKTDHSKRKVL